MAPTKYKSKPWNIQDAESRNKCFDKTEEKAWINNKIIQIDHNQRRNDTRKFFQEIKTFKPQQIILPMTCKDTNGNVILQIDEVLARWKEYFQNLLSMLKRNL